jgi:TonB family protein
VATILSTVIHFFIFTLLDTVPLISKEISPQPNLYMVDLVSLAEERPVPQREEKPAVQQKVEEAKKEEPKRETVKEEKKKDIVVMEDRDKDKATKENKKKPTVNDEQQRLAAIKEIERKVAGREADGVPVVTEAENNAYGAMIQERVERFWVIPDTLLGKDLKAVIIIEIDQQGQVIESRFEQSSGNLSFDQSAMRAVSKAVPFPSPPGKMSLEIGLIFQPR